MEEKINYNDEPVYYCKKCNSLRIIRDDLADFCDDCGSTEILTAHIDEWLRLKEE